MARKKILVCGSLGFLMSNFVRYLLYRTKEYEITSVDRLTDISDHKRIYINRSHNFHLGDICSEEFVYRLMLIEKPDIIINGINPFSPDPESIVKGAFNLSTRGKPVIQLTPHLSEQDPYGWWSAAAKTACNHGGKVLEIPNCFGMRQKPIDGVAKIIRNVTNDSSVYPHSNKIPWSFSEDVCSLLWYMVEKIMAGQEVPNRINSPIIGEMSPVEIARRAAEKFEVSPEIIPSEEVSLCKEFPKETLDGWVSDYDGIDEALEKTMEWFSSNKWALGL